MRARDLSGGLCRQKGAPTVRTRERITARFRHPPSIRQRADSCVGEIECLSESSSRQQESISRSSSLPLPFRPSYLRKPLVIVKSLWVLAPAAGDLGCWRDGNGADLAGIADAHLWRPFCEMSARVQMSAELRERRFYKREAQGNVRNCIWTIDVIFDSWAYINGWYCNDHNVLVNCLHYSKNTVVYSEWAVTRSLYVAL